MFGAARALHWWNQWAHCPWLEGLGNPLSPCRDGDRELQFFPLNEEFPVSASHQLALITSLPFVHTARRYYRFEWFSEIIGSSRRDGRI